MDDKIFFTINRPAHPDPIQHLKNLIANPTALGPHGKDVDYFQKFIDFSQKDIPVGCLDFLLMSNSGETKNAVGLLLIHLGTDKNLEKDLVPELYNNLYEIANFRKPQIEDVYFTYTQVSGIWEWWEEGSKITKHPYGTLHEDKFIGFARVRLK